MRLLNNDDVLGRPDIHRQTFKIDLSWAGLKAECLKCHAGCVTWSYVGIVECRPAFKFACERGNEETRGVFNSAIGFPQRPDSIAPMLGS